LSTAKQTLLNLLSLDLSGVKRMLKAFELLDAQESEVANFDDNYLNEPVVNRDVLIKELDSLFPNEVIIVALEEAWGVTHFSGGIVLHSVLFEGIVTKKKIVQIMLLTLHELAHKKKLDHMSNQNYCYKTPPAVKRLYLDVDPGTTGCLIEKKGFGGRVYWKNVTEKMAEQLMDCKNMTEESWNEIASKLIEKPLDKIENQTSVLKSAKLLYRIRGCATEHVRQALKNVSKKLFF